MNVFALFTPHHFVGDLVLPLPTNYERNSKKEGYFGYLYFQYIALFYYTALSGQQRLAKA